MQTIYRIKFFSIFKFNNQAKYLEEMHKSGWKLVFFIFPCIYIFQECKPEEVIYQIDFNEEVSQSKEEYVQMFIDTNWEYLQTTQNFSFFRKPLSQMEGEEHIFSDEQSQEEMVDRIKTSKTLPKLIFIYIMLGLCLSIFILSSPFLVLFLLCFGSILLIPFLSRYCLNNHTN